MFVVDNDDSRALRYHGVLPVFVFLEPFCYGCNPDVIDVVHGALESLRCDEPKSRSTSTRPARLSPLSNPRRILSERSGSFVRTDPVLANSMPSRLHEVPSPVTGDCLPEAAGEQSITRV